VFLKDGLPTEVNLILPPKLLMSGGRSAINLPKPYSTCMLPTPETSLLIFTQQGGPRLDYIISVLFGKKAAVTESEQLFTQFGGARIQYLTEKKFDKVLHVQPQGLVFESDIHSIIIECARWEGYPIFFSGAGDIPFDIFSAAFYLVSRYEEYLPFTPDKYDRFPHTDSLAYREGFLSIPLVQHWVQQFKQILGVSFSPSITDEPIFLPTYDADILFQYKHQSIFHNLRSLFGHLLHGRFSALSHQIQVIGGSMPDPYYQWPSLWKLLKEAGKQGTYFFSANEKQQGNDRQLSIHLAAVQSIIQECSRQGKVGWHPSLQSSVTFSEMKKERGLLQQVLLPSITDVRFHFLRFRLPESYRWLIDLGIDREHSMGYGAVNGFRASYADPFPWFDLQNNKVTSLLIHPFCYMDTAAIYHQHWAPAEAMAYLKQLQKNTRGVVDQLALVFHPHCLATPVWKKLHDDVVSGTG